MKPEYKTLLHTVLALVVAGGLSFGATPLVRNFAEHIGAMDVPRDARRMHKTPIPRLGGLAIFLGFMISTLLFVDIDRQMRGILLGAVIIVITGVVDDITPLNAWVKLIMQIIAAVVAVLHGVVIQIISNPNLFSDAAFVNLRFLAIPVTIMWIVLITNAVNLIDGLDGLAVGVSCISSCMMLVIALLVAETNIALLLAALVGACIGFMPFNFNPAKIFMGDTGALMLGYVLAAVSVTGLFKMYAIVSFAVPFLILGLPLFDTVFAILRRVLSGKSPMTADRGHFHHRLIDMGLSQKQAVAILYIISAILGVSAVVLTTSGEIKALFVLVSCAVLCLLGYAIFELGKRTGEAEAEAEMEAGIEKAVKTETEIGTGKTDDDTEGNENE